MHLFHSCSVYHHSFGLIFYTWTFILLSAIFNKVPCYGYDAFLKVRHRMLVLSVVHYWNVGTFTQILYSDEYLYFMPLYTWSSLHFRGNKYLHYIFLKAASSEKKRTLTWLKCMISLENRISTPCKEVVCFHMFVVSPLNSWTSQVFNLKKKR